MDAVRKHGTRISDYLYPDAVDLRDYDGVFAEEEDAVEINGSPAGMGLSVDEIVKAVNMNVATVKNWMKE